ncbi:MAG: TetR family transcriptional regulator [Neisseria sp.]|nr:TetR family transcriptional regulator [Neisseria sp.]
MISTPNDSQTIARILSAAENHFALHGFFASSLRQIMREAQANVAAAHYHFGSKEALFLAVIHRRIAPFLEDVLAMLQAAEAQQQTLTPEHLTDSFIASCLNLVNAADGKAGTTAKLVSRLMLDEYRIFREELAQEFSELADRLYAAFARALPDLPPEACRWRMHLALSTLFNAFAGNDVLKALAPASVVSAKNAEQVAKNVRPFVIAGLKAPL